MKLCALCIGTLLISGCAKLPTPADWPRSSTLEAKESRQTTLGQTIAPLADRHPGLSGIHPLADAEESFVVRLELCDAAEKSLDIQYYIWRADRTGMLLFGALYDAAERGVRVRLLMDDYTTGPIEATLGQLHSHPNIEVRLFNPFIYRGSRFWGFLTDFSRANRRMHNKSLTADAQASIVGGRNIADYYFGADDGRLFADLDVLAIGPVARGLSEDFDRYWISPSTYPIDRLIPAQHDRKEFRSALKAVRSHERARHLIARADHQQLLADLQTGTLEVLWAPVRIVSDDPAKGLGQAEPEGLITHQLQEIIGTPTRDVELVSPYFVPTAAGTRALIALADRGVEIRVLTNSLAATNVPFVHAGYAKRRKALLKGGVILYEMKPALPAQPIKGPGPLGSSGTTLHAKTFSVDRSRVFVGSFNFDPRSANLNTELGLVIESPELAARIEEVFGDQVAQNAYEVRLDKQGQLYWLERRGEEVIRHEKEPGTGFWQRRGVGFFSILPIEWLL